MTNDSLGFELLLHELAKNAPFKRVAWHRVVVSTSLFQQTNRIIQSFLPHIISLILTSHDEVEAAQRQGKQGEQIHFIMVVDTIFLFRVAFLL
jgi:hypothetical protein